MTNEQYLVVSYFCVAAVSLAMGFAAYAWLRRPLREFASALPWKGVRGLLLRLFPAGIVLPALLGFVSVSYRGCNIQDYNKIIANREYLVAKNQEQISSTSVHVVWAVFAWCALLAILLAVKRRQDGHSTDRTREQP